MRRIVQIVANNDILYALASDGTLWHQNYNPNSGTNVWVREQNLPDDHQINDGNVACLNCKHCNCNQECTMIDIRDTDGTKIMFKPYMDFGCVLFESKYE